MIKALQASIIAKFMTTYGYVSYSTMLQTLRNAQHGEVTGAIY